MSWIFGGPSAREHAEQAERADELRKQNERGFTIRDKRERDDEK